MVNTDYDQICVLQVYYWKRHMGVTIFIPLQQDVIILTGLLSSGNIK